MPIKIEHLSEQKNEKKPKQLVLVLDKKSKNNNNQKNELKNGMLLKLQVHLLDKK